MLRRTLGVGIFTFFAIIFLMSVSHAGTTVTDITIGGGEWQIVGSQIQHWHTQPSAGSPTWNSNSTTPTAESNRYEWRTTGTNRLTMIGSSISGETILGSNNYFHMSGGNITGSLTMYNDVNSSNQVILAGGSVNTAGLIDVGYGSVTISGSASVEGEIRTNIGNTLWEISGGTFSNGANLHGQGGVGTDGVSQTNTLNISGNATFTDSFLNFDAGNSYINVTGVVAFSDTAVKQDGSAATFSLGDNSSFTGGAISQNAASGSITVTADARISGSVIDQTNSTNTLTWDNNDTNANNTVRQSGVNNTITLGGASVNNTNTFSQTGTYTTFRIQGAASVDGTSLTQTGSNTNTITISTNNNVANLPIVQNHINAANSITASNGNITSSSIAQTGSSNTLTFSGSVSYTGTGTSDIIQSASGASSIMVTNSARINNTDIAASGYQSTITLQEMTSGLGGSAYTNTVSTQSATRNFLNLYGGANAGSGSIFNITGTGNFNRVDIDLDNWSTIHEFLGIIDMSGLTNTASDNLVTITSGRSSNSDGNTIADASIRGSSTAGVVTYYDINGGNTRYIDNGASTGHYTFANGGRVYNIFDSSALTRDDFSAGNTAAYTDAEDYLVYTILNMHTIDIVGGAQVTIGHHEDVSGNNNYTAKDLSDTDLRPGESYRWADDFITDYQAQITADTVNVVTVAADTQNTRFVIHENSDRYGLTGSAPDDYRNVINELNIEGASKSQTAHVTINQTTLHGSTAGDAQINVGAWGVLHGFGEFTSYADHDPKRPNLIGDLYIGSYGKIQPYDNSIYTINSQGNYNIEHLMGVVFQVEGDTTFDKASILSTRLFARYDSNTVSIDGTTVDRYFSDSVDSTTFDFTNIWNGARNLLGNVEQSHKVQYDPVFGFSYELIAKQEFEIYDAQIDETTYWFQVANSDTVIKELFVDYDTGDASKLLPDANHLFNRDILKSDMLGEWFFTYNDTQDAIVLRYRMLAEHPTKGGIAIGMLEPNAREAAKKIDEMRYPFATDYTDIKNWPDQDQSYLWGDSGFDGDIVGYYEQAAIAHPDFFDNYDADRIKDFEHFLHAIQKEIQDAGTLNHAMRLLHAESYVTNSSLNIGRVQQFQNNIQRNGISALFQVEQQNYQDALAQTDSYQSEYGYASVSDDLVGQFVCNPTRFWASGFGNNEQTKKRGTEYGYKSDVYGGAVGVIQEIGDLYIGLTGGYAHSENKWRELKSEAKTDSLMGQVLIGLRKGMGFFEFHADYAYNDHKLTRNVWVNNYQRTATGDYSDHTFGGGFRMGYQKLFGCQWLLVPTVGIQYLRNDNFTGFTEKGPSDMFSRLKMKSGALKRNLIQAPFMARLNRPIAIGDYVLTPEVRAGMTMTFGNRRGNVKYEYLGNPISGRYMKAIGYDAGTFSGQLGTTLELSRFGRFYAAANYDYYFAKRSHNHSYSMQAGMNF